MLPGLDSVLSPFSPHHSSSSRRERREPTPEVGCRRLGPPPLALETEPDPCLPAWTTCSALGHACFPQLQPWGAEVTDEVRKGDSGIPELHVRRQISEGKEFGPSPARLPGPPAHCRSCPGLPRAPSPPVRLLQAPRALPCQARSPTLTASTPRSSPQQERWLPGPGANGRAGRRCGAGRRPPPGGEQRVLAALGAAELAARCETRASLPGGSGAQVGRRPELPTTPTTRLFLPSSLPSTPLSHLASLTFPPLPSSLSLLPPLPLMRGEGSGREKVLCL